LNAGAGTGTGWVECVAQTSSTRAGPLAAGAAEAAATATADLDTTGTTGAARVGELAIVDGGVSKPASTTDLAGSSTGVLDEGVSGGGA
jgi:hypothetical protein